jgi:hypothetical protein
MDKKVPSVIHFSWPKGILSVQVCPKLQETTVKQNPKHVSVPVPPYKTQERWWITDRIILVLLSAGSETINAGHYWGTLTVIREAVCCNRPEDNAWPHSARTTVIFWSTGRFFPILPVVLTYSCSPKWRRTFRVYTSKLTSMTNWRTSNGCVCRMRHFTTKGLTLWAGTVIGASNRYCRDIHKQTADVHMADPVLLTVNCLYCKYKQPSGTTLSDWPS